jgi:Bacterial PH domain
MFQLLSNNSKYVDASTEEQSSRSKYPELLHKDEKIFMAFKSVGEMGRDKQYLTNRRVLVKNGKGIGSKRRNYLSVPYETITSFSVESAGSFLDTDVELHFTATGGINIHLDFCADKVNIYEIQQFFNEKVLLSKKEFQDKPATSLSSSNNGGMDQFMHWLGDNAVQLNAATVQEKFTNEYPVLLKGSEEVQLAFKVGRDTTIITNKRFFVIDVKGWSGKRVKFVSVPWSSISAFAVETAGNWDRGKWC